MNDKLNLYYTTHSRICKLDENTGTLGWEYDGIGVDDMIAELAALKVERDEAVKNADNYRQRVFDFLDGMSHESEMTQELEESRGLAPVDREQFRHAIAYIRNAFENHNYLTEAKLEGSFTALNAAEEVK